MHSPVLPGHPTVACPPAGSVGARSCALLRAALARARNQASLAAPVLSSRSSPLAVPPLHIYTHNQHLCHRIGCPDLQNPDFTVVFRSFPCHAPETQLPNRAKSTNMHGPCKPASGRALLGLLVAAVLLASPRLAGAQTGRHDVTFEGKNYGAAGPPMAPRPSGLAGGSPFPSATKAAPPACSLVTHAPAPQRTQCSMYKWGSTS